MLATMSDDHSNAGDLAIEFMGVAQDMILAGEDPDDVRAAFIAVAIRMGQLREEADQDVMEFVLGQFNRG